MGRNVTVQVGDELAGKMEKLSDVNWSEVVRGCLETYCNVRLNSDIEALAKKMKEQKEEAYSEGYKAALEWFKQEDVTYKDVNAIFNEIADFESEFDREVEDKYGSWESANDEDPLLGERYDKEEHRLWKGKVEEITKELSDAYDITDAFIEGFKAALRKLLKVT